MLIYSLRHSSGRRFRSPSVTCWERTGHVAQLGRGSRSMTIARGAWQAGQVTRCLSLDVLPDLPDAAEHEPSRERDYGGNQEQHGPVPGKKERLCCQALLNRCCRCSRHRCLPQGATYHSRQHLAVHVAAKYSRRMGALTSSVS